MENNKTNLPAENTKPELDAETLALYKKIAAQKTGAFQFLKRLATPPPPQVVSQRAEGGQNYEYLKIAYVERQLKKVFLGRLKIEVVSFQQMFNSIAVHVRIHFFHPLYQEWQFVDGTGAASLQQDKGSKVADFNTTLKANAVKLALPIARAEAIKNAAKFMGEAFGGGLNRADDVDFTHFFDEPVKPLND